MMDWREIISLRPDKITNENRESIFESLCRFDDFDRADNKSFKKLFRLSHKILQWKGEEVTKLKCDLKNAAVPEDQKTGIQSEVDSRPVSAENMKLRKLVERLENEKSQQKIKLRQLTEEIQLLQKRIQANPSEREDSPDALSDLEKQEELLSNMSAKNKHITRLLADLEELEGKNARLTKDSLFVKQQLNEATTNVESLNVQFKDAQLVIKDQMKLIEELNAKNHSLDEMIHEMQREVDERDGEITEFGQELEKRVFVWKRMLDTKQNELESLKIKYEDVIDRHPGYNIDAERAELTRLTVSVKERDSLINDLEEKVFEMSNELITSTEVINKLLMKERELKEKSSGPRSGDCCSEAREKLSRVKGELKDAHETILSLEEENILKAKQVMETIERLSKYENGEEGLPEALKRVTELEQMVRVRDKDIKDLVKQINRTQNVARENIALREQVGIDESEIVPTTFVEAKFRKMDKKNERLTLKLRASEEMRLKMKLERNELMKQLRNQGDGDFDDSPESDQQLHGREDRERLRLVQEEIKRKESKWRKELQRLQENYEIILKENENLRIGMYEILNKLRECEGTTNEISVDSGILNRLLDVLDSDRTGVYEFGPYEASLDRPPMNLPKTEETKIIKSPEKKKEAQKFLQDVSSQTHFDVPATTSCEFEDLLGNLREILDENGKLSDELAEVKGTNQVLRQRMKTESNEFEIDSRFVDPASLQSKCEFLLEENAFLCRRLKEKEQIMTRILKQVQRKFVELKLGERAHPIGKSLATIELSSSEGDLMAPLTRLKAEICKNFFEKIQEDDLWKKITQEKNLDKVAVIEDDLQASNFITVEEFNRLITDSDEVKLQLELLRSRNRVLEETLKTTAERFEDQQRIETSSSDEVISLRHLVVDLQSSGSEKQLIARVNRDLIIANEGMDRLRGENVQLQTKFEELQEQMKNMEVQRKKDMEIRAQAERNTSVKYKYLRKTVQMMHAMYSRYTPLVEIETFVGLFRRLQDEKLKLRASETVPVVIEEHLKRAVEKLKSTSPLNKTEDRIDLIRWTTQCDLLGSELKSMTEKVRQLEEELHENRVEAMKSNQHWMAMKLLLEDKDPEMIHISSPILRHFVEIGVQVDLQVASENREQAFALQPRVDLPSPAPRKELQRQITFEIDKQGNGKCLESQLKQAMILASTRSALLLETENRLAEAQGRIKAMERCVEERERTIKEERDKRTGLDLDKRDENVFSITIASLQNLLLEKDTTLSRYQELLKTERMEHSKSCSEFQSELDTARAQNDELNRKLKARDVLLEDWNRKFTDLERMKGASPIKSVSTLRETDIEKGAQEVDNDDPELSFNLLDSAKFEQVFIDESKEFELAEKQMELQDMETKLHLAEEEINRLQLQLIEVSKRERGWDAALAERDLEIESLTRKLRDDDRRSAAGPCTDRNLEELKEMLEEKDRHIHDLTKTLTHFHDDQQNYLKDTTLSSAEDMARLSSELTRADASNKVLNTQIEALKRQMANLEQREKQSREMVKTLKQQLMKRPVISVGKTMHKEDQYQRRIESLQADLAATKEELRKQTNLADQRRTKGQQELQLWEKQKRAQQSADKLKMKLADREQELEKVKCQLSGARQAVSRMEREKQVLEAKRNSSSGHCCPSPSCPSLQRKDNKRPAAETPETDNTEGDEDEEEEGNYYGEIVGVTAVPKQWQEANNEVIKALKARVEIQQRKIVAMELEGKGSNVMSQEMEKLQERVANLESQNLRLEAKNLQLQLENDLLKKGDEADRQQRQIKHLEDYVLVLKEELSQAVAVASTVAEPQLRIGHEVGGGTKTLANMEQTILALKRIVERLRLENKALKEGKTAVVGSLQSAGQGKGTLQKTQQELKRVQDLYAEALNKISSNCRAAGTPRESGDLKMTMAKLEQKTQLLEKAKILLTRAAAKEKNLREQIEMWRRKCSELQNVPVIEEISE